MEFWKQSRKKQESHTSVQNLPGTFGLWIIGVIAVFLPMTSWRMAWVWLALCTVATVISALLDHRKLGEINERGIASILLAAVFFACVLVRAILLTRWNYFKLF